MLPRNHYQLTNTYMHAVIMIYENGLVLPFFFQNENSVCVCQESCHSQYTSLHLRLEHAHAHTAAMIFITTQHII